MPRFLLGEERVYFHGRTVLPFPTMSTIEPNSPDAIAGGDTPREFRGNATRLAELRAAMHRCVRCPALSRSRSCVVPGDGAVAATVAFVGIAPGRLGGDRTGIPFSGDRSGELLRRMIHESGLRRVFITNLVRCSPRDDGGRNRDPDAEEIANCRDHLEAELTLVRPRIVACLGRIAWRELAGRAAPFEPSASRPQKVGGRWVYPMYHPGYAIRGAYSEVSYRRDFADLARWSRSIRGKRL
jgi:uracil-DNA glycosylase family 4